MAPELMNEWLKSISPLNSLGVGLPMPIAALKLDTSLYSALDKALEPDLSLEGLVALAGIVVSTPSELRANGLGCPEFLVCWL